MNRVLKWLVLVGGILPNPATGAEGDGSGWEDESSGGADQPQGMNHQLGLVSATLLSVHFSLFLLHFVSS